MKAYLLIKTRGGKARNVLNAVRELNGVKSANGTYGSYDIIAKIDDEDVAGLVVDKIRTLDGVVDTNTLIIAL